MLDKHLMKVGFIFRYVMNRTHKESVILKVAGIQNRKNNYCDFDIVADDGSSRYYGHNEFDTFDDFIKINTPIDSKTTYIPK